MQIEKVIGKKCLIRKNTENLPIEAHIICLNEDRTKFSAKLSSGEIIWLNINGKSSVYDIANAVKKQFGDDAEPLYPRLIKYMQILKNNNFISFVKEK